MWRAKEILAEIEAKHSGGLPHGRGVLYSAKLCRVLGEPEKPLLARMQKALTALDRDKFRVDALLLRREIALWSCEVAECEAAMSELEACSYRRISVENEEYLALLDQRTGQMGVGVLTESRRL